MARTVLDTQLQSITTNITQLGALTEQALEQALQAVQTNDQALCGLIVASDTAIDDLRAEIDRLTFKSLTLQQPLGGRDLRFLSSAPSITTDLERTADNAVGIAKLLLRMVPLRGTGVSTLKVNGAATDNGSGQTSAHSVTEESIIAGILTLGQEAQRMLHATMQAFTANDAQAAHTLLQADDVVDECYSSVRHDLMTMLSGIHAIPVLQQDGLAMQRMTYLLWIAHNLERVGDHCTNVCERIVFFIEGDKGSR
ncbi:MAG: phosphate signaling complex protein PhoU [Ktedonobacteraceae bacterium]